MHRNKEPLADEAEARPGWRGDESARPDRSGGHSLPASEDEEERMGDGKNDAVGHPGTIPPPD